MMTHHTNLVLQSSMARMNLLLLALAWAPAASARDLSAERLDTIEASATEIHQRVEALETEVAPGRGFITQAQAVERYQDYVYLYMIGDFPAAAEGFYTLVTTASLADAGLHRDAEWYLAESLFQMKNLASAEARYQVIADDAEHPFRDDAIRRLLELYASSGQVQSFHALYEQEIVTGRVRPSDVVTYAVAKAFRRAGDADKALEQVESIGEQSPYFRKALYFRAAVLVSKGMLDEALPLFRQGEELSVDTQEDRRVHDLCLLALGRIYYEQGRFDEASEAYVKIGGDSEYMADKLYEITWTYIKQERFSEALDQVSIFLLAFPEHQYAAQLRVLEGHLHMKVHAKDKQYASALQTYERVIVDYTPIRERFKTLAHSEDEPGQYFRRIIELDEAAGTDQGLPAFAMAMMLSDADLSSALTVYRELERQRRDVEVSEGLIVELTRVLESSVGIGGFDQLRYDVLLQQSMGTDLMQQLLEIEEVWLRQTATGGAVAELDAIAKDRVGLQALVEQAATQRDAAQQDQQRALQTLRDDIDKVDEEARTLRTEADTLRGTLSKASGLTSTQLGDAEARLTSIDDELGRMLDRSDELKREEQRLASEGPKEGSAETVLMERIHDIRSRLGAVRTSSDAADKAAVSSRIDGLWTKIAYDRTRLTKIRQQVVKSETTEMTRIRARFNYEVGEVAAQRAALEQTLIEAQEVSIGLTRAGFGRLEDFFAESVLKADMGVVDVYWTEKLDVADNKAHVQNEKTALLEDLEARFNLIRQKLNQ